MKSTEKMCSRCAEKTSHLSYALEKCTSEGGNFEGGGVLSSRQPMILFDIVGCCTSY
jgi:hypothetical protein